MADHTSYTSSRRDHYPYVAIASAYLGRVILPSARHRTRAGVNVIVSFVLAAAMLLSSFPYSAYSALPAVNTSGLNSSVRPLSPLGLTAPTSNSSAAVQLQSVDQENMGNTRKPMQPNSVNSTTVTVSATCPEWTSTGLTVNLGDHISSSASGSWSVNPVHWGYTNPDGYSTLWGDNFLNIEDIGNSYPPPHNTASHFGGLVGYIGSASSPPAPGSYASASTLSEAQRVFFVGSTFSTDAVLTGTLWLGFNDAAYSGNGGCNDNDGTVTATVSVAVNGNGPTSVELGSPSENHCSTCAGKPINTASGEFWHTFGDLSVPGRGVPLAFSHSYRSFSAGQSGPLGNGWTHNYNMYLVLDDDNKYQVHEEAGSIVPFNSDFSHDPRVLATLTYSSTTQEYQFTRQHDLINYYLKGVGSSSPKPVKLVRIVDRNGYPTTLQYDSSARLTSVTDPASRNLTFSYIGSSQLIDTVTDPASRTVHFSYTSSNLTSFTDVGGKTTNLGYDGSHHLLTMQDPNGGTVTTYYDASSLKAIKQTDPLSRMLQLQYTDFGSGLTQTTITDTLGLVTVQDYNQNRLMKVTQNPGAGANQKVSLYNYDASLSQTYITDPNNHVWHNTSDSVGNLLSTTDPLLRTVQYAYNSTNDLTVVTATNGLTTTFGYDTWGNVTTVTRPVTETSQLITSTLTYDPIQHGDVLTVTDPLTHSIGIGYNSYGYPITTTNALTATNVYTYNTVGWLLKSEDPLHHVITSTYDTYGEPLIVTNTLGYTTTYGYDDVGNLLTVQDANHKAITNTYDLDNEITRATNQDGTHSDYGYDVVGRVLTQTNPLGQSTLYRFDDINRRIVMTDALTRSSSAAYDLAGVTTVITDARGYTTTLGYDAAYQLKNITYHDTLPTAPVSYDYNVLGMRTVMTDGLGTSLYTYDSLNRLKSMQDSNAKTVSYGYDLASRLTSITYPNNGISTRTVTRGYDNANRLTSVSDWSSHTSQFGYNADDLLTSITYPNGITSTVGYNAGDQLTSITHNSGGTPFLNLQYTPDPVGVITATNEGTRGTHNYGYDQRYRLTGDNLAATNNITDTWGYSAATEIITTSETVNGGLPVTTTRTYNAANQLLSLVQRQNGSLQKNYSLTYDYNGNRLTRGESVNGVSLNYTYDAANRLTQYAVGGKSPATTYYDYSGDGLRMVKTYCPSSCTPTNYVWDINEGLPLLLQDRDASYIYGPGGMILEEVLNSGNSVYYYHPDKLGSVRALSNSTGTVTDTYNFDAYGNKLTTSTGTTSNPFGYTGQYTDSESGMLYLRARYYDPLTEQFLTVDPMVRQTEQAYAYVGGSPTNGIDPSGLDCGWFPNFFDESSCVRKGLGEVAGKVTVVVGVVLAGGVIYACFASGVCEVVGIVGAVGAAGAGAAKLEEGATQAAFETDEACTVNFVYRGVNAIHPEIEAARRGIVIPGNINGIVTAEEHNIGLGAQADSAFTSWSRSINVANYYATRNGPGGVILRLPFGDAPSGATWRWVTSPDLFQEEEVLLWGTRHGAYVFQP